MHQGKNNLFNVVRDKEKVDFSGELDFSAGFQKMDSFESANSLSVVCGDRGDLAAGVAKNVCFSVRARAPR